jgi:hypothetical protein
MNEDEVKLKRLNFQLRRHQSMMKVIGEDRRKIAEEEALYKEIARLEKKIAKGPEKPEDLPSEDLPDKPDTDS